MRFEILIIFLILLLFLSSCSLFFNIQPDIVITYKSVPIQYSLDLYEEKDANINININDADGMIKSVILTVNWQAIDITGLDAHPGSGSFEANYTLTASGIGQVNTVQIAAVDDMAQISIKEFQVYFLGNAAGDINHPVEIIIPEIQTADGGVRVSPAPSKAVSYYNWLNSKAESDIRLSEPAHGKIYARRYLKVAGTAVPDDSGYKDRQYHTVIFSIAKNGKQSFFTFPVSQDQTFRGYLYFPEPGTYLVAAYRNGNDYLYPANQSRGTLFSVGQGSATLKFTVVIAPGDEVPAAWLHLLPTRNVDNGTNYLRLYAQKLTGGITDPMEQVKAIYQFLATGDEKGSFQYKNYFDIYPGYLDNLWSGIFIASHFLNNREGVCNDFSELFAALTRASGFKVQKTWGYIPGAGGHQWNRIFINDRWYVLDSTWAAVTGAAGNWKSFAEFHAEFDADYFRSVHEETYSSNLTTEY